MLDTTKTNINSGWENFFTRLQSKGRYSFTYEELRSTLNLNDEALSQGLYRYKQKKQIAKIRKGFYAIIPPEYSRQKMLPPSLFIDDLMKSLSKPYYVALQSAAATYGAAHQQPMEYYVIAETPAPRSILNDKLKIIFLSKKEWEKEGINQQKTNAGYINISSPELTALDLFSYNHKIGVNRIVTILQELTDVMKVSKLTAIAKGYSNTVAIQRLGYVLETEFLEDKLANTLWKILNQRTFFPTPLSPQKEKKGIYSDNRWQVIKNMEIESDL